MAELRRAARNNNPCNIRICDPWQGLLPFEEMTDDQKAEKEFCIFQSPKWGFRAAARVLISYQDKYQIQTIRSAISRWAPPSENDTAAYMADVCARTTFDADGTLDLHTYEALAPLIKAIATHETGSWIYDTKDLDAGLRLAGVEASVEALAQSRTIKTGVPAATGVVAVTAAVQIAQQLQPAIQIVSQVKEYWPYAAITILVVAIAAMTYDRIDDWRRAKR